MLSENQKLNEKKIGYLGYIWLIFKGDIYIYIYIYIYDDDDDDERKPFQH